MIFKQIDKVLDGTKTQTRRVVTGLHSTALKEGKIIRVYQWRKNDKDRVAYEVGKTYPIIPKRGQKAVVGKRIKITSIRVEPLQFITDDDARAEGCNGEYLPEGYPFFKMDDYKKWFSPSEMYRFLWESINTRKGVLWDDNPAVFVITFEVVNL